jgi:hypothetical protein
MKEMNKLPINGNFAMCAAEKSKIKKIALS